MDKGRRAQHCAWASFCTTATSAATTTTPGVYHSANLPTTSCVRETVSFAFWTASWMRDWKLALTSASAVTNKNPECNKEPPRTFEPLSLSTGLASPVTWLSSTEPSPLTTVPSAGIASPFRTWNCMPTLSSDALIIRSSANMAFTSPLYSSSKTAQMSFSRTRSPRLNCLYRRRISKLWSFNDIAVLARAFSSVYASMMTASSMFNKIKTMINMKDQNQICAFSRPISAIMPKSQSPNMARKQEFTARGRVVKPSMSWPKNKMLLTTRQKKTQKKTMPKWIKSSVALSKVLVTIASRGCAWKDLNNLHMMMLG
mmetsp:Transcript_61266/g.154639  ORF Transcript_61266/g.154639 Transcript_61266/m.154639 type:complete len:314 (-) Transcript_61266:814-1755(-)